MDAQLKGLESEAERKELNLLSAIESEKQATQMLSIQKAQWENHKRILEERSKKSDSERKRLQQLNDEFQVWFYLFICCVVCHHINNLLNITNRVLSPFREINLPLVPRTL